MLMKTQRQDKREMFRTRLRRLMDERGWSVRKTAIRIGLPSHGQVCHWLAGAPPKLEYLPLIATAFGMTLEELVDGLLIHPRKGLIAIGPVGTTALGLE